MSKRKGERKIKYGVKASNAARYTLTSEDVCKIIDATQSNRDKVIIELLAFTGCRRQELALLRIKDIDFENNRIMMPTIKQKTNPYNTLREVPIINNDLKRDLITYIELIKAKYPRIGNEDLLIQSQFVRTPGITPTMVSIIVRDTAIRAGVKSTNPNRKWIQPHIFRHTFVRTARKKGIDYANIQEMVGHTDISTTIGLYGKPTWQDKVDDVKKMKDFGMKEK